jgi:alpha-methylacyl-CoA racemase
MLLQKIAIATFANQTDRSSWPDLKPKLTRVIASGRRDEWCAIMEGTDVCFAPVLSLEELHGTLTISRAKLL